MKQPKPFLSHAPEPAHSAARALPPRPDFIGLSAEEVAARKAARDLRDAQVRGVASVAEMRQAIREASAVLPTVREIVRIGPQKTAAFRERARAGLPFIMTGMTSRWPLAAMSMEDLRKHFGQLPVRARVGDYINTAFAPDRAMQDMTLVDYLERAMADESGLPPYLGNLELRALNALCHWPNFFEKMGPPRFWIGPTGCITPLHCDYDDNVFAQVWGKKRVWLAPPHHDQYLYPKEANAILFGSPFDPDHPDLERYPLARQAALVCCDVQPGEMLYIPAGWYHQVSSLSFSLSSNRWARGRPLVLAAAESAGSKC